MAEQAAWVCGKGPPMAWLRGWARSHEGETLAYHAPYPDAETALITRATDGRRAIAWETEPVPREWGAEAATFVWLCGLATHKGGHRFLLEVQGATALEFRSGRDASDREWEVGGEAGLRLRFRTTLVDRFEELFGFMWLTVPRERFTPGQPVRLTAVGEAGESPDWFMLFEYDLRPGLRVHAEEACVRRPEGPAQLVRVELSHLGEPQAVTLQVGEEVPVSARLATGYNAFHLEFQPVDREQHAEVQIAWDEDAAPGVPPYRTAVTVRPVAERELWLLPHSHLDIGYTDHPEAIAAKHWRYYREALALARQTAGDPPAARFKWNVETLWAVESYLEQCSPDAREAFLAAVRRGEVGLQALFANELTGICHPEELFELTACARRIAELVEQPIHSAMITDIPSYTWSLVPALAQAGVRYLSSGPNYMPRLADGGDRIGSAARHWGDRPFYWVSASGEERILLWMTGRGYSWFHGLNLGEIGPDATLPILAYVRDLGGRGYPYSMVQVRYTIGGDNGPPDPRLPDFVRAWNERFISPRMRIATSDELFAEFERRHGVQLPVVRGDFTPYWEDGAASSARETAENRRAANRLVQAQALWAQFHPNDYPAEQFYRAWRQVLLFDEHTWGAAESVSAPDSENARAQWAWKASVAAEASRQTRALLEEVAPAASRSAVTRSPRERSQAAAVPAQTVDVINTHAWTRTDLVLVPARLSAAGDCVRDERGAAVPAQRLSSGELAFRAQDVPALGLRRYTIGPGPAAQVAAGAVAAEAGRRPALQREALRLELDSRTGAIASLRDRGGDAGQAHEFVDTSRHPGLNAYLYIAGRSPGDAAQARLQGVSVLDAGPLLARLRIRCEAPGCRRFEVVITICAEADYISILNLFDKEPVRTKESVHFAYPFAVPDAELLLDLGWAWLRPEQDQIPGACRDYIGIHAVADYASRTCGITWATLDAPLVEVGELTDESVRARGQRAWRQRIEPSGTLYSYALNNYWHTNYRAEQEGPIRLEYALRPHAGLGRAAAKRFGLERSQPLVVAAAQPDRRPGGSLLGVASEDILLTSVRPSRDGAALIARLYNAGKKRAAARLSGDAVRPGALWATGLDERRRDRRGPELELEAAAIEMLRIERSSDF